MAADDEPPPRPLPSVPFAKEGNGMTFLVGVMILTGALLAIVVMLAGV